MTTQTQRQLWCDPAIRGRLVFSFVDLSARKLLRLFSSLSCDCSLCWYRKSAFPRVLVVEGRGGRTGMDDESYHWRLWYGPQLRSEPGERKQYRQCCIWVSLSFSRLQ